MVFQNYALYPHISVRENIAYPLKIAKLPLDERNLCVKHAAKILYLTVYRDRRPISFPGAPAPRRDRSRHRARARRFRFDEPLIDLDALLRVQMGSRS